MSRLPMFYNDINAYNSVMSPSTVHVKNTELAQFFKRYLLQDAMSVFKWGLPEGWDRAYFLYTLYIIGYIAVMKTPAFGVFPQHGYLGGRTVQYGPRYITIANPILKKSYKLIVDKDCTVLRLEPDYFGLYDLVDYYGDLMALAAEAVGGNLLMAKSGVVFGAKNKAVAESYKAVTDQILSGEPAAFADSKLFDQDGHLMAELFNAELGRNFIADRLMDVLYDIRCRFLTDIGIPNANRNKKERLNSDEVHANDTEVKSKCSLWLDELKEGCEKANAMFGINLTVDWRDDLKEVMDDGKAINSGNV